MIENIEPESIQKMIIKEIPNIVKLFQILAQEELKHKNRLEKEFDEAMLSEN